MNGASSPSRQQILDQVRSHPDARVRVAIADIDGVLRGKYMHRETFLSAVEDGFGFCSGVFGWDCADALYDNCAYTGPHTGYPDAKVKVDLSTFRRVPWDDKVPFFLGDFVNADGSPLAISPRQLAKQALAKAERMGFQLNCGMEFEWVNFVGPGLAGAAPAAPPEPISTGMFGYSFVRVAQHQAFFKAIMLELEQFGIELEGLHTENGPGNFEAAIRYRSGIEAADRGFLFKDSVKQIAHRFGIMPSFMAKWNTNFQGCSAHAHQSLSDGNINLFHDERDPDRMSELFKHYVAGLIYCLPHMLPLLAPTVNSYKRLVDGHWAPVRPDWAPDNRTVAFRVLGASPRSMRVEARVPGADVNPYLSMAACLAAGLYGIEHRLPLPPAANGAHAGSEAIARLPRTLGESVEAMRRSAVAQELFGADFVAHFAATREWEWRQFQDSVTDWELQRYREII